MNHDDLATSDDQLCLRTTNTLRAKFSLRLYLNDYLHKLGKYL